MTRRQPPASVLMHIIMQHMHRSKIKFSQICVYSNGVLFSSDGGNHLHIRTDMESMSCLKMSSPNSIFTELYIAAPLYSINCTIKLCIRLKMILSDK